MKSTFCCILSEINILEVVRYHEINAVTVFNVESTLFELTRCIKSTVCCILSQINILVRLRAETTSTRFCVRKRSKLSRKKKKIQDIFNTPKQNHIHNFERFQQSSLLTKNTYCFFFSTETINLLDKCNVQQWSLSNKQILIRGSERAQFYIYLENWLLAWKPSKVKWQNIRIKSYIIMIKSECIVDILQKDRKYNITLSIASSL